MVVLVRSLVGILSPLSIAYRRPTRYQAIKKRYTNKIVSERIPSRVLLSCESSAKNAQLTVVGDQRLVLLKLIGSLEIGEEGLRGLRLAAHLQAGRFPFFSSRRQKGGRWGRNKDEEGGQCRSSLKCRPCERRFRVLLTCRNISVNLLACASAYI